MNSKTNEKFMHVGEKLSSSYDLKSFSKRLVGLFCSQHLENAKFMDLPNGDPEKGYEYLCYASTIDVTSYIPGEKIIRSNFTLTRLEKQAEETAQANLQILANCLDFLSDPPDPALPVDPFPNLSIKVQARGDSLSPYFEEKRLLGFYLIIRIAESAQRIHVPFAMVNFRERTPYPSPNRL